MGENPGGGKSQKPKFDANQAHIEEPGKIFETANNGQPEPPPHTEVPPGPNGLNGSHYRNGMRVKPTRTVSFEPATTSMIRAVEWVWPGRIARGKLTIINGDPEQGKTCIGCDLLARITRGGDWPGQDEGTAPCGNTLVISAEDSFYDTIKPRLLAAGADISRVTHVTGVISTDGDGAVLPTSFSLQCDLDQLPVFGVIAVLLDPLNAFLGDNISSHEQASVRGVLGILDNFAEKHRVAILGVMHPPKSIQASAINAVSGSRAFTAAARFLLQCVSDPKDPDEKRHIFASGKNNLGRRPNALAYSLEDRTVTEGSVTVVAPWVAWEVAGFHMSADQAMALGQNKEAGEKLKAAEEFLRELLSDGPVAVKQGQADAKVEGISEITLRRAREALKIVSIKSDGEYKWFLPQQVKEKDDADRSAENSQSQERSGA